MRSPERMKDPSEFVVQRKQKGTHDGHLWDPGDELTMIFHRRSPSYPVGGQSQFSGQHWNESGAN